MAENDKFRYEVLNSISFQDDTAILEQGKGKKFVSRFIEPGIVSYEKFGDVLVKKETIDKFLDSIIGCPVIIKHKDITAENVDKERVGVVSNAWYNSEDGWYYCDGIIFDKQAIDLVKNQGWSVSCTYDFESDKQPLTYNGKELAMEFSNGEFLHLALVPNPRYNDANIVMNSKVENKEHWITVGAEDGKKGTHILVKDGETNKEATERKVAEWKNKDGKEDKKDNSTSDKTKVYTEDDYDEFHKKFYKDHDDKWTLQRTTKGYDVHRTNEQKKWEFEEDLKKEDLSKFFTDEVIKLRLPNVEKKNKEGKSEFFEDEKSLQFFKDKGYEPSDKYDDGYYTNFILKKKEQKQSDKKEEKKEDYKSKDYTNVSDDELREKLYKITTDLSKKHGSFEKAPYEEKEEYYFYNNMLNKGYRSKGEKKEQPKEDKLDIKKTTVKMKSGKEKEIEYVDKVPEGYKVLEGAMTAPLGYTWYTNGKSLLKGEHHPILVKDKSENAFEIGLNSILDDYKPVKEDLPILNGLKDILQ